MKKQLEFEKYSKALGLDDMHYDSCYNFYFTNLKLENDYLNHIVIKFRKKKFFIDMIAFMIILFALFASKRTNEIKIYFYLDLLFTIVGLTLLITVHFLIKNPKRIKTVHEILTNFILCIYNYITLSKQLEYKNDPLEAFQVRDVYMLMVTSFILLLFCYDYSLIKIILVWVLITGNLIFIAIISFKIENSRYKEVVGFTVLFSYLPFYCREKSLVQCLEFLKKHQLSTMFEYFSDIVENMNEMLFSVNKANVCISSNQSFIGLAQVQKLLVRFFVVENKMQKINILDCESIKEDGKEKDEIENYKLEAQLNNIKTRGNKKLEKPEMDQNGSLAYLKGIFPSGNSNYSSIANVKLNKNSSENICLNVEKNIRSEKSSKYTNQTIKNNHNLTKYNIHSNNINNNNKTC